MNKLLGSLLLLGMTSVPAMAKNILDKLTVAPGFEVSLFADDVENARQIAVSKKVLCTQALVKQVMYMRLSIIIVMA